MKKKILITVYTVLVSLIFIGTIIFSGTSLYVKNSKGYTDSKLKFDSMCIKLQKAFENPESPTISEKIQNAVGSYDDYAFINIKVNGNTCFLYPGDKDQPAENTKFSRLYFKTMKSNDLNLYVSATIYTLSPSAIAYQAKIAFIIILIFTLITIMLIFIISNTNNEAEEVIEEEIEQEPELEEIPSETIKQETEKEFIVTEEKSDLESAVLSSEDSINEEDYAAEESENEPVLDEVKEENEFAEENISEEQESVEEQGKVTLPVEDSMPCSEGPQGLFSPDTGFGWESYLSTRLDNELVRASSSEFDLCLFMIKISGIDRSSETMKKISEVLTAFFQFKDMIFEFKDDCFAAIKTNTNIDDAIPQADNLYSNLCEAISETEGKVFIGLTSKTIRLISADRLIKEAEAAMNHAQEEPECPIIAFRADAEKYMDFIENS